MTKRDRLMILGVIAAVLIVSFYMFAISPAHKAAADAKAEVLTAQSALAQAQQKVTSGKAAQTAFRKDRATIVKIGRVVPETDDIPTLITQLETLAHKYDVYFIKYTIAQTTGASASSAASPSAAAGSTAASSSSTAQPGAKGVNSSTNAVAPLYPPGSVEIAGGLGRTPIIVGLRGQYFNLERYLRAVERFAVLSAKSEKANGRLIIVDGFSYKAGDLVFREVNGKKQNTERWLEAELGASVYFAPPLDTPTASGAPAASAAGAATPASTTTPSTSTGAAAIGGLR